MSEIGRGGAVPAILAAAVTPVAATVLPRTGMSTATQIAIATVAALVVWAVVYMTTAKFSKR